MSTVVFVASHLSRLSANQAGILLQIVREVRARGYRVAMCSLSDQVYEVLARTGVADAIGLNDLYPSELGALAGVWEDAHHASAEEPCPLEPVLPRISRLSLHPDGSFRDAARHRLALCRHIAMVRFDGRLDYATLGSFERGIDAILESGPELRWVLIAGHTLERIDAVAAEGLAELIARIRASGRRVGISGLREDVLARLQRTGVEAAIGAENVFATQERALQMISADAHRGSDEAACPLLEAVPAAGIRPGP